MKQNIIFIISIIVLTALPALSQDKKIGEEKGQKNTATGFGQLVWGASLSAAKEKVEGKIIFVDEKRIIISKDGDIEYRYGFFYKEIPEEQAKKTPEANKQFPNQEPNKNLTNEAKLYYVIVRFPYLPMEEVKKKIEEKYGMHTGEIMKNNRGALVWDFLTTTIVLWVDDYKKNAYCQKITYLGKEIAKEVNEYQNKVFTEREREILRKLIP
ncbi:MAG: hypothetical protein N2316_05905 [Spirochaetes bacterium]|nr:hypothetical protein [Spirochaetota bacterium]